MGEFRRDVGFAEDLDGPSCLSPFQEQFRQRRRRDPVARIRLKDRLADRQRAIPSPMAHKQPCGSQQELSLFGRHVKGFRHEPVPTAPYFLGGVSRNSVTMIFSYWSPSMAFLTRPLMEGM